METNQFLEKYKDWKGWLQSIENEISELSFYQNSYGSIRIQFLENPEIYKIYEEDIILELLSIGYFNSVLLSIRRQMDTHEDCKSLLKLLNQISSEKNKYYKKFTWQFYYQSIASNENLSDDRKSLIKQGFFEKFTHNNGDLNPHFQLDIILDDIKILEDNFRPLRTYIDQRLCHYQKGTLDDENCNITYDNVKQMIENLQNVANKYILLLTGTSVVFKLTSSINTWEILNLIISNWEKHRKE